MAPPSTTGLTVRVGTALDALADDLALRLARSPLAVLAPEFVVVPTVGVGRWLESRLSERLGADGRDDGIWANVDVVLVGELLRRVTGVQRGDTDPWSVGAMTTSIMGALLSSGTDRSLDAVRDAEGDTGLFLAARGYAGLFEQLFRWRPDVAETWLSGSATDPRAALLCQLAAQLPLAPPHRRLDAAITTLRGGDDDGLDLPLRVQLFGADWLPGGPRFPSLLDALGSVRDVSVHLVVPSVDAFVAESAATPAWQGRPPDRAAAPRRTTRSPLLRAWGTTSVDAAMTFGQLEHRGSTRVTSVAGDDVAAVTLLSQLQRSVRDAPAAAVPPDGSISLHGCVGDQRQVEVARDAVLHVLNEDPTLEAADVAILCPDLPRFAAHVEAVLGDPQGAPRLPYVLRDRSVSRAVPLVAQVAAALRMLGGRVPRSAVIDLFRFPMVQRRFDVDDEDVDRIAAWTVTTDVRWGLDASHRARVGLPLSYEAGTWRRALDQLLAGIAFPDGAESAVVELRAVTPGHDLERLGALCGVVAAIADLDDATSVPRGLRDWCAFTREVLTTLFAPGYDDEPAREQLQGVLARIEDDARHVDPVVPFAEFRALFEDRVADVRDVVASGSGGVTVTSLAPLRHVPFKVLVLLGLDEASIERPSSADLAFGEPRVGDRDPRADVRAALLGAVLSTRSRLIVTYEAADVVTNETVAPASVLSELREAIAEVCTAPVVVIEHRHPRHAHGDDDLVAARSADSPFSFDGGARQRAVELRAVDKTTRAHQLRPLEPPARGTVDRAALISFLTGPQRAFLAGGLGVRLPGRTDDPGDELSTTLDELDRWKVTRTLVIDALAAFDGRPDDAQWSAFLDAWLRRPDGPLAALPGRLGSRALFRGEGAAVRARDLHSQVVGARGGRDAEVLRAEVADESGDVLLGDIEVLGGRTIVHWTPSSNDRRARIEATVDLLLLTAAYPDTDWRAVRIWREERRAKVSPLVIQGDSAAQRHERATHALSMLLALRHRGLCEPVPLFFRVTLQMLTAFKNEVVPTPADLLAAGLRGWTQFNVPADQDEPAVRFCFDESYEELCSVRARHDDPVVEHDAGGSRLLTYSLAMLEGLCAIDPVTATLGTR